MHLVLVVIVKCKLQWLDIGNFLQCFVKIMSNKCYQVQNKQITLLESYHVIKIRVLFFEKFSTSMYTCISILMQKTFQQVCILA